MTQQIEIRGKVYDVLASISPARAEEMKLVFTAREMRDRGVQRNYRLRLPRGKSIYEANEFEDGSFGKVVKLT